jgi:hypothetical protein
MTNAKVSPELAGADTSALERFVERFECASSETEALWLMSREYPGVLHEFRRKNWRALAVTTTPTTGVTIVDWNLDGGNIPNPIKGNGSSMSNSGGQAMGYFGVTFASAGTFALSVAYTSTDADYANTSSTTTVVVS